MPTYEIGRDGFSISIGTPRSTPRDRIDMQVLVGRNDGAGDLRPAQQLAMALRDEIGLDLGRNLAGAIRVLLGKPNPFHRRMARRHLAAEQADAPAADDRKADAFGVAFHCLLLAVISEIAEMVSLVSGRSIGSPRAAERSAAR